MGVSPIRRPTRPPTVSVSFEAGVPVAVNGEKMKVSDIIRKLNKLGGENGVGILDIVENRLIGMKRSRHLRDAGRHDSLFRA